MPVTNDKQGRDTGQCRWVALAILAAIIGTTLFAGVALAGVALAEGRSGSNGVSTPPPDCGPGWSVVSSPNVQSNGQLRAVAALSANDVWAVGSFYATSYYWGHTQSLTEHWNGTSWNMVPSPDLGTLTGVAAISSNDIWAVGSWSGLDISGGVIEHWDGTAWTEVPFQGPGGQFSGFTGVAAVSSDDVWAVGDNSFIAPPIQALPLIEHWNGTSWNLVSAQGAGRYNSLYGVTVVSSTDVWAVGDYFADNGVRRTLIERWDGTSWSVVPSPNSGTGNNYLRGVAASSSDVLAVGYYHSGPTDQTLVERWNGTSWSIVTSPNVGASNNYLYSVGVLPAGDWWAVGKYNDNDGSIDRTLMIHAGVVVPGPDLGASQLNGVATMSTGNVLAVGNYFNGSLIEHWDGAVLGVVSSPNPGDNVLNGVTAVSSDAISDDAWAVGSSRLDIYETSVTLIERWNGTSWNMVPSPNPIPVFLAGDSFLQGVAAVSSDDVWAVGYYNYTPPNDPTKQTLIEHWNGTSWSVVASPNVGTGDNVLSGIAAVSNRDVWAVGSSNGQTLFEHWNGTYWKVVVGAGPDLRTHRSLYAVAAVSSNDVWAVGNESCCIDVVSTLIEHWDGTSWSVISSPNIGTMNTLKGIAAVSSKDIWAVGGGGEQTLTEHWDGASWSLVSSPSVGGWSVLNGVAAVSSDDVWAAGSAHDTEIDTLIEHWDGASWSVASSPNMGPPSVLNGIAAISSDDVWAAGKYSSDSVDRTLVERYNPCTLSSTPTSTPSDPANTPTLAPASTAIPATTSTATAPTAARTPTGAVTATPTATANPTSCAIQFTDVPSGSTFYDYITCLACRGIITGYSDGTFRPNSNVTRGQAAKIIANSVPYNDPIPPNRQTFTDVPPSNLFWLYIERIAAHGAISGYPDGTFRPTGAMTRGQIAKIDAIAAGYDESIPPAQQSFSDVSPGSTFWLYIERMALHGVVSGYSDGTFRPTNNVTRGQASRVVANTFFPNCQTPQR